MAKWHTHYLEVVAPQGMRVRLPPSAQSHFPPLGRLAQLVEHLIYTERVTGSSPVSSTIYFVTLLCYKIFSGDMWREPDHRIASHQARQCLRATHSSPVSSTLPASLQAQNLISRGSSVVEHCSEKAVVEGPIPFPGTLHCVQCRPVRASYSGYYATLPRLRRQFDSARPLQENNR